MAIAIFLMNHAINARSRGESRQDTRAVGEVQSLGNSAVARLKKE
jgi:hypothetical protein